MPRLFYLIPMAAPGHDGSAHGPARQVLRCAGLHHPRLTRPRMFLTITCFPSRYMLYISGVNQPALTTGRPASDSQGKGNPMKANARHVPGSTRSCRTPLSRSANSTRRFEIAPEKSVHYAPKMRPNFKTQILIYSLSTTY